MFVLGMNEVLSCVSETPVVEEFLLFLEDDFQLVTRPSTREICTELGGYKVGPYRL